jgi:hypothetical protein
VYARNGNPPQINVLDTEFRGHDYGFYGAMHDSEWARNDFHTGPTWGAWSYRQAETFAFTTTPLLVVLLA